MAHRSTDRGFCQSLRLPFLRAVAGPLLAATVLTGCAEESPLDIHGPRNCELSAQNEWVYGLMQAVYLWAPELPDVDPAAYDSPATLIADLRYKPIDRWSRVSDLATTEALYQQGMVIGLGTRTLRDASDRVHVAFVHPLSPAGMAGIQRGDELLSVAGMDIETLDANDGWEAAYGPNEPGVVVDFEFGTAAGRQSLQVTKDWYPVKTVVDTQVIETENGPVGHLMFTSFLETSEAELDDAFDLFAAAGVRRLVVDLRYNGGGRISTAHHFMELLVGDMAEGSVAYSAEFEGRLESENFTRTLDPGGASLSRVDHVAFVITPGSASASELLINGVRPHTQVSVIGTTSAGKPVGSRSFEFCDKVANPITFRLLNADGVGDYFDGISPTCAAGDDLGHLIGDVNEGSLHAALSVLDSGVCPPLPDPPAQRSPEVEPRSARWPRAQPPGNYPGIEALDGTY